MEVLKARDLMILVDGQNFISQIRKLFEREFNEEDYLPRNANWQRFFNSIAKTFAARTLAVHWYTIKELDFWPHVDWSQENFDQFSEEAHQVWRKHLIRPYAQELQHPHLVTEAEQEYLRCQSLKRRKWVVNRWRRICHENQVTMEARLEEWHRLLDDIALQCPNVEIRRAGWQACRLVDKRLFQEKGVDTALAIDLVLKETDYDMAILLSGDGDFVPAIAPMQERGKKIGIVEFRNRYGEPLRGTARRLSEIADFTLEIPWEHLKEFLGMPDEPIERKRAILMERKSPPRQFRLPNRRKKGPT